VSENIIAVGDMMKSISLVEYTPGKGGLPDKLDEVARHMDAIWTTSVVHIEGQSYLETDHYGNLLVLRRNINGVTLEDRKRLEMTSEMNLGEQVNKVVRIEVEPSANAMVIPKAFLATVSLVLNHVSFSTSGPNTHTQLTDRGRHLPLLDHLLWLPGPINASARPHERRRAHAR
jgi:DNA damage-binding protein 1